MKNDDKWLYEIEKRKLLQETIITDHKKNKFIREIKNGLGEEILKEPNKLQKKLTLFEKLKKLF